MYPFFSFSSSHHKRPYFFKSKTKINTHITQNALFPQVSRKAHTHPEVRSERIPVLNANRKWKVFARSRVHSCVSLFLLQSLILLPIQNKQISKVVFEKLHTERRRIRRRKRRRVNQIPLRRTKYCILDIIIHT